MEAEGWVLAGGQSRRMGQDKAAVVLAGVPLLVRMLGKLDAVGLSYPVRVAGLREPLEGIASEVIADAHPDCGPLGGIETALRHSRTALPLVISVDLPLVPVALLRWMLRRAAVSGATATVPRVLGQPQPLCAVYRRELSSAVLRSLIEGDFKVMRAIERGASELGASELGDGVGRVDLFDVERVMTTGAWPADLPPHLQFLNCNTPSDLALAETLLARAPML